MIQPSLPGLSPASASPPETRWRNGRRLSQCELLYFGRPQHRADHFEDDLGPLLDIRERRAKIPRRLTDAPHLLIDILQFQIK